jgi:ketosteroid isomerase-like protein
MSRENVEAVRRFNDSFRRGDWDTMAATMDQHILIRTDARWPERYIYGREATMAWYRDVWESWGPDACIEEIVDLGDRVLVRFRWIISGQQSGVAGEQRFSEIATLREGRVILTEYFLDHEQALKAVGLKE